jgi:hypothetical protein
VLVNFSSENGPALSHVDTIIQVTISQIVQRPFPLHNIVHRR